jgi:hypothetical protein
VVETVTGAASATVAGLVAGPPQRAEVVVALPVALHLAVGGQASVCLSWADAVRLPSSVHMTAAPVSSPGTGAVGVVGAGRIELPALTVRVTRWWRAPRPTVRSTLATIEAPPLDDSGTAAAVERLAGWLSARGSTVDAAVAGLLGRGPGLTPLGDDVLAGALVTLRAAGAQRLADALARPVLARAPAATTFVSSALLAHAARGECVPELAALLHALGTPGQAAAEASVLRLGHTSGAGLLHGVAAALGADSRDRRLAS